MSIEVKLDSVTGEQTATFEVIEVHVSEGEHLKHDDVIMVVEGDKAIIEVTSQVEGLIKEIMVSAGQTMAHGDIYLKVEPLNSEVIQGSCQIVDEIEVKDSYRNKFDVVVIGAGPGGYTAAFRAADLGMRVALIERYPSLGGVCLNVGCIPSKSLLHIAKVINEAKEVANFGVEFPQPIINISKLRGWKDDVLANLTSGVRDLANLRKVKVFHGTASFRSSNEVTVENTPNQKNTIRFDNCIIAAGSRANKLDFLPKDSRIIDSAEALSLNDIPARLLIIGGGIIGLEMATVYSALGSKVTVVAKYDQLIPECDADIIQPLYEHAKRHYEVYLETVVTKVDSNSEGLTAFFESNGQVPEKKEFDKILLSIGRHPNGRNLNADLAGIFVDDSGFIPVDKYQRTNVKNIFAIGDIVGKPMLAHKALHEAKVAAEVAAGHHSRFDAKVIPSVAYTDPEVAWVGLTEKEAKKKGIQYGIGIFPWAASGRALSLGRCEGKTKILFDLVTDEILGASIVGVNAGDLIAEISLAIENNITAGDLASTIHPHPTLSETVAFASEVYGSTITDLYMGKSAKKIAIAT